MHRFARTTLALVSCLLASCAATSRAVEPPAVEGTAWVLSSLPGQSLAPDSIVTLSFAQGRATGTDGCNRYVSSYTARGAALRVGSSGASTQMACSPAVMRQAEAYMASLTAARSYAVEAGQLELMSGDGRRLAAFTPQSQSLAGTSWRVTAYNNGRQAVVSVLPDTSLTMTFSADGKVSGSAGCNNYTGTYEVSGTSLHLGPAAATRRMCAEPERVMEQERQFLEVLGSVTVARQEGDRLELRTATEALAVSLTKEAAR